MRLILSFLVMSAFGFVFQTCNKTSSSATSGKTETVKTATNTPPASSPATVQSPQDDAPRITLADAKKSYDEGSAVIVDARGADSYKIEHIKGAINIPLADFEARYKEIPTNKKIIVYCS